MKTNLLLRALVWCRRTFLSLSALKERFIVWHLGLPGLKQICKIVSPNQLCYFRMFASPFILWMLMEDARPWSFVLFAFAVYTDLIDGPLARSKNEVTEEGKNLDPMADKMLISIPLLLVGFSVFDGLTTAMYLFVELLLVFTATILKPYLRQRFGIPLSTGSNAFGQLKMVVQSFAVGILVWNPKNVALVVVSETLVWCSIALAVGSFIRHLARMDSPVEPRKRIVTWPNLITISAIFTFVPAIMALTHEQFLIAGICIAWIFVSDLLDGYIARRFNQETAFGAVIDPLRDFLARVTVLIWMFATFDSGYSRVLLIAILLVELFVGSININTAKRCRTVQLVTSMGQKRTFVHYVCFGGVLLIRFGAFPEADPAITAMLFLVLIFSLLALVSYVDQRRKFLSRTL